MKRVLTLVLSALLAFSMTVSAAAVSPRATGGIEVTLKPNSIVKMDKSLSMEADETVTINCTGSKSSFSYELR
jgi:hypothetical protein